VRAIATNSEANVQAEFYHQCRLIGLPVALEVTTPVGRLDVAVLNATGDGCVAIVECKKAACMISAELGQVRRYKKIGVPVYGLTDKQRCRGLAKTIQEKHAADPGVGFAAVLEMPRIGRPRRIPQQWRDNLNIKGCG